MRLVVCLIAGRAGRFGIYETGYVNIMEDDERFHIEHMLSTDDTSQLSKLPIAPNFSQIEAFANKRHNAKLAECLEYFAEHLRLNHECFELSSLETQYSQALLVDAYAPNLSLKDKWIFACAPISINVSIEKDYFLFCLKSVAEHSIRHLPIAPDWLDSANPKYVNHKHLETAEILSQNISLYAWLGYKFPQIFVDVSLICGYRKQVSAYIASALLVQAGYGQTARETDTMSVRK